MCKIILQKCVTRTTCSTEYLARKCTHLKNTFVQPPNSALNLTVCNVNKTVHWGWSVWGQTRIWGSRGNDCDCDAAHMSMRELKKGVVHSRVLCSCASVMYFTLKLVKFDVWSVKKIGNALTKKYIRDESIRAMQALTVWGSLAMKSENCNYYTISGCTI